METRVLHVIIGLLKTQHAEIIRDLENLKGQIALPFSLKRMQNVGRMLRVLDQRVVLHLIQEDQLLYPKLVLAKNSRLRATANRLQTEMGGMAYEFSLYIRRWRSEAELVHHWGVFVEESLGLTTRLSERIRREEDELFPLLDPWDPG
ncbi:MAG: hemerythrin domain-containing protein [Magnetococcales bacterium]|nr:hemerythrin domain-containing protein [Magnetococcales bacterium]